MIVIDQKVLNRRTTCNVSNRLQKASKSNLLVARVTSTYQRPVTYETTSISARTGWLGSSRVVPCASILCCLVGIPRNNK